MPTLPCNPIGCGDPCDLFGQRARLGCVSQLLVHGPAAVHGNVLKVVHGAGPAQNWLPLPTHFCHHPLGCPCDEEGWDENLASPRQLLRFTWWMGIAVQRSILLVYGIATVEKCQVRVGKQMGSRYC